MTFIPFSDIKGSHWKGSGVDKKEEGDDGTRPVEVKVRSKHSTILSPVKNEIVR